MDEGEHKKTGNRNNRRPGKKVESGFEPWTLWQKAVDETDIDPADFFDPEEFGYRRRGNHARSG